VTLCHLHQVAPMAAAVAAVAQQNHATLARIRRTRSPTMRAPTKTRFQVSNSLLPWPIELWTVDP
jgi:hypothetical protein